MTFENDKTKNQDNSVCKNPGGSKFFMSVLNVFYVLCLPLSSLMALFSPMAIYNHKPGNCLLIFICILCVPISLVVSLFKMESARLNNELGKIYFFGVLPIIIWIT